MNLIELGVRQTFHVDRSNVDWSAVRASELAARQLGNVILDHTLKKIERLFRIRRNKPLEISVVIDQLCAARIAASNAIRNAVQPILQAMRVVIDKIRNSLSINKDINLNVRIIMIMSMSRNMSGNGSSV